MLQNNFILFTILFTLQMLSIWKKLKITKRNNMNRWLGAAWGVGKLFLLYHFLLWKVFLLYHGNSSLMHEPWVNIFLTSTRHWKVSVCGKGLSLFWERVNIVVKTIEIINNHPFNFIIIFSNGYSLSVFL